MKRILPCLFCLFLFASCQKDEVALKIPAEYELANIVFSLEDGDGIEEVSEYLPEETVTNHTNTELKYMYSDSLFVNNESQFISSSPDAFLVSDEDSVEVITPKLIQDGVIYTGLKFIYSDKLQYNVPETTTKDKTTVPPKSKLTVHRKFNWKILTTTFTVTFEDKRTGLQKEVTGKWKGKVLAGTQGEYLLVAIK